MTILEYCTEEVERQGHDLKTTDGVWRVAWMMDAWMESKIEWYAEVALTVDFIEMLGRRIEPVKNKNGFRHCAIWVGDMEKLHPSLIREALSQLVQQQDSYEAFDFYREFERIHPFIDGNGRVGKILLNWKLGRLHYPVFPPDDFWGRKIKNP